MRTSLAAFLAHVTAGAAIVATSTGSARADAPSEVPFSPLNLAVQSIPLPEAIALEDAESVQLTFLPSGPTCEVSISGGAIGAGGAGPCGQLWMMSELRRQSVRLALGDDGTVELTLVPRYTSAPERLTLAKGVIALPPNLPPDVNDIAVLAFEGSPPRPIGWVNVTAEAQKITLDADTAAAAALLGDRFRVYALGPDNKVVEWRLGAAAGGNPGPPNPGQPPGGDPANPGGPATSLQVLPPGTLVPAELACPPKNLPNPDMIIVCVDASGPQMTYRLLPEGTRNVKPNRYFYVHIVHQTTHHPSVVLGGQIGSWVPGARGHIDVQTGGGLGADGSQGPTITLTSSSRTFAPRRPGFAPLAITLFDNQRAQVNEPLAIEFWIDETYSGAFRVGIGGIFLGGVERRHHAVTRGNSLQSEIEVSGRNVMDVDLMLGYSPYLDSGGRAATGCDNAPFCFNPYFGLGVVSVDSGSGGGGVDWLKSVHLGVEWEVSPAFAVAVTANLRRVQRLAGGLHPGDPIEGDIPTENRYVFGVGLVVNLSPTFFKIGAGGPAALLQ
jgi:hypothetical protein